MGGFDLCDRDVAWKLKHGWVVLIFASGFRV